MARNVNKENIAIFFPNADTLCNFKLGLQSTGSTTLATPAFISFLDFESGNLVYIIKLYGKAPNWDFIFDLGAYKFPPPTVRCPCKKFVKSLMIYSDFKILYIFLFNIKSFHTANPVVNWMQKDFFFLLNNAKGHGHKLRYPTYH